MGDYPTNSIEIVEDPCPPLQKKFSQKVVINEENENEEENEKEKAKPKKKRTLKQNEKLIYAPFADLNALNFDKSGGYITIPEEHIVFTKIEKPSKREELLNIFEKVIFFQKFTTMKNKLIRKMMKKMTKAIKMKKKWKKVSKW